MPVGWKFVSTWFVSRTSAIRVVLNSHTRIGNKPSIYPETLTSGTPWINNTPSNPAEHWSVFTIASLGMMG